MIKQESVPQAYKQLFDMAVKAANHLGHIPTDQPQYNPLRDPEVLEFMSTAIFNEMQAQSQREAHEAELIRYFDELDKDS